MSNAMRIMNRLVHQMDQALGRAEKSEVLDKNMDLMCATLQQLEEFCTTLHKRLRDIVPEKPEKRKRTPEEQLALAMGDCGKRFTGDNVGVLLCKAAEIEECLLKQLVQYEINEDDLVLRPLATLDEEYKKILKRRKALKKLILDRDAATKKYNSAARQSTVSTSDSTAAKLSTLKDEMDDLNKQVDHERDALTTEILAMTSKEADFSDVLMKHVQLRAEYHKQSMKVFESLLPEMMQVSERCSRPLYGTPLKDHLTRTKRRVASVIQTCAYELSTRGLAEEGLFRLAGLASKTRMLKAAFDAQNEEALSLIISDADHHSIAAALKSYLRELPEPLGTFAFYEEWKDIDRISNSDEKIKALKRLVERLPVENRDNLSYLFDFFGRVASHSDRNKMTPSNLAIVISPNLFWSSTADKTQFDVSANSVFNTLVEFMIRNQHEIFPGPRDRMSSLEVAVMKPALAEEWETSKSTLSVASSSLRDGSSSTSPYLDLPSENSFSGASSRSVTPPDIPPSPKPSLKEQMSISGIKKKVAPAAPPVVPKRVENLPSVPATSSDNSRNAASAPPETPVSPVGSSIDSDITLHKSDPTMAPILSFEPTVVPVKFHSSTDAVPVSVGIPVPNPVPRKKIASNIASLKETLDAHSQNPSSSGELSRNGGLEGNGDKAASESAATERRVEPKPVKAPTVPPRQMSENNTYL